MIKPLSEKDLSEFIRLRMSSLKTNPEAFGAAFEEGIDEEKTRKNLQEKNEENFILGYFHNGEMLGMVGFIRRERIKSRHTGWIWGMYVDEKARGKGIGILLMENCIAKASALPGLEKIMLEVTESQHAAKALYEKLGFVIYGKEENAMKVNGKSIAKFYLDKDLR